MCTVKGNVVLGLTGLAEFEKATDDERNLEGRKVRTCQGTASSTTCLQFKNAVDVWIICEVHKVLLSLLVYVLTNRDPV